MESSSDKFSLPSTEDRFVLVIVTGGTIAIPHSGIIKKTTCFDEVVEGTPVLNDPSYRKKLRKSRTELGNVFALPKLSGTEGRIVYCLYKFETFKVSPNMGLDDYNMIAITIEEQYANFCGFVILHGTDTMAYTASYLSFMLENHDKSVVLTGAQIPIYEARSDAVDNFLGAVIVAGVHRVPEVTIYFSNALHRGNRTRKVNSLKFASFDSPNSGPLIHFGVHVKINSEIFLRNSPDKPFSVNLEMEKHVGILRLYPGLSTGILNAFLSPPTKGVVLCSYGTGHISSNLLEGISRASKKGVLVLNCTQCDAGGIPNGDDKALVEAGVINGRDVTPEAGLAKLSYVLGKNGLSRDEQRALLELNLRGEITEAQAVG